MKKAIEWFKQSNRWKHLAGGMAVGFLANDNYTAAYSGVWVAAVLEFKDEQHGGKWDWIDYTLTIAGVAAGRALRILTFDKIWNI